MSRTAMLMSLSALTPVHAGCSDKLGIIDLPIQREVHTSFPKIEASSLKGSIRHSLAKAGDADLDDLFGPDNPKTEHHASAISFSDARILFFPIKSVKGIFAWVTCPMVLERFIEDLKLILVSAPEEIEKIEVLKKAGSFLSKFEEGARITQGSILEVEEKPSRVVLEEYLYETAKDHINENGFTRFVEGIQVLLPDIGMPKDSLMKRAILIPDAHFTDFVNQSTEVATRIKINSETGTVINGALFNEEYLPSESILYSIVFADAIRVASEHDQRDTAKEIREKLNENQIFQIGANMTLGKGLVAITIVKAGDIIGGCESGK